VRGSDRLSCVHVDCNSEVQGLKKERADTDRELRLLKHERLALERQRVELEVTGGVVVMGRRIVTLIVLFTYVRCSNDTVS